MIAAISHRSVWFCVGAGRKGAMKVKAPPRSALGMSELRRHHLSVVLEQLLDNGPTSRAALAQETGLTKATVSTLVTDLLERDLVEELNTQRDGRIGRPGVRVAARMGRFGGVGLQIERDHVAACVVNFSGQILVQHRRRADNLRAEPERIFAQLGQIAVRAIGDAERLGLHCVDATLAVPGLVEPGTGKLRVAPNLHWLDADLSDLLVRLVLPVGMGIEVENEANLGALAELRCGAGRRLSSFVYLSAGSGIGAGMIIDGYLVRGSHGFAGELGHIVVEPDGRPCACGARGCLETIFASSAGAGSQDLAEALAAALRSVVHVVDPEAIILGGRLANLGDGFTAHLRQSMRTNTLGGPWHPCEVTSSAFGADATLIGAGIAALDGVLTDPTRVPHQSTSRSA